MNLYILGKGFKGTIVNRVYHSWNSNDSLFERENTELLSLINQ